MLSLDRGALVCDLAETYQVYDMQAYSPLYIAELARGLRPDSRIKLKMAGLEQVPPLVLLDALIVDELRAIRYVMLGGKDLPVFVTDIMQGNVQEKHAAGFATPEEFEARRKAILERIGKDGG